MNVVVNWDDVSRSSIRSKLEDKKNTLQFLPQSLEEISKLKNFTYKEEKLKVAYLIDIVHNLLLKYYFKRDNQFSLSAVILKEKYGYLYNYYINYLVENNVILMLTNYKAGTRARVYALSETILRGKIIRYRNSDKVLLKKYKNKISQVEEGGLENPLIDNDIKAKLVDDLFYIQIQFDRSIFYLDSLKNEDNDIYNRNKYSVECINDKHIFYHFDNYGRFHTNFTILKSFIRKNCLMIDGQITTEIDIPNSQPLFLFKLINDIKSTWVVSDELNLFEVIVKNGSYYQYLIDNLSLNNKSQAKDITYKVFFGRNYKNCKSSNLFRSIFPTIYNFICLYKKEMGSYKSLAYELQKIESNFIFNKLIRKISIINPDIRIVTVHDSIIIDNQYKELVYSIFRTELDQYLS